MITILENGGSSPTLAIPIDSEGTLRGVRWKKQVTTDENAGFAALKRKNPAYSLWHLTRTGTQTLCGIPLLTGCCDGLPPEFVAVDAMPGAKAEQCPSCKSKRATLSMTPQQSAIQEKHKAKKQEAIDAATAKRGAGKTISREDWEAQFGE